MRYNELNVSSNKSARRVGRGIAAGRGKTAGRGTKGQNARKSGGVRPGFEGGQTPLMQLLPKMRGFRSPKAKAEVVYTGQLTQLSAKSVDSQVLAQAGLISSPYVRIKLISKGELTKALTVQLPAASVSAIKAIEKAGGKFVVSKQLGRPAKADNNKSK